MYISEAEIKQAVHKYCQIAFSEDLSPDPPFVFSQEYIQKMRKLLDRTDRRLSAKRTMRHIAACVAAMLVIFVAICISSPKTWAAARTWYVINIGPDQIVYVFNHTENNHALLVVRPNAFPEGFEMASIDEGEGYSIQRYENAQTGEYVNFSYHWLTVREQNTIDRLASTIGTKNIALGYQVVLYSEKNINKIAWYDQDRLIGFWAESNMPPEKLASVFDTIEMHPPVYIPTWLPEGYEMVDSYYDGGNCDLVYLNNETEDIIAVGTTDYGILPQFSAFGEGETRDVIVNNKEGFIAWGGGQYEGTVLVLIDKEKNLVIDIQTGSVDPELVLLIAESLVLQNAMIGNNP